jgi:predicted dehydrogenase
MINIAIVGTGAWGPNIVRSLKDTNKVNISWICDLNKTKLELFKSKYSEAKLTTSIDEVLSDDQVEAVCIATPVATHYELATKVLNANKHLLIEKPITPTSEEAIELHKLAESKKLKLMVGHVFEYNSTIQELNRMIREGELGTIQYINFERTNLGPIRTDVDVMWDLAPHDHSILNLIMDDLPTSVTAKGGNFLNKNIHDVVFQTLSYPNGSIAHIHSSWINPCKTRTITIVGSKKMVLWDDLDLNSPIKIYDKKVERADESPTEDFMEYKTACINGGLFIPNLPLNKPLQAECEHFLDSIINDTRPQSDGISAYKVIKILEAADQSMKNNSQEIIIDFNLE